MWICPVCGKLNRENVLCAKCGFDESRHYKRYRTLTEVTEDVGASTPSKFWEKDPSVSREEEPFDIFLSCRETDEEGKQTPDSILADDLYRRLTERGFRVFLSGVTLEDMARDACAPYLFAALASSKVMVALGTKPEHFYAEEVFNKWSRYLSLIQNGDKKLLIPAYRDMDPGSLPERLSGLQAQDMSDSGFIPKLLREIRKVIAAEHGEEQAEETDSKNRKTGTETRDAEAETESQNAAVETLTAEYAKKDEALREEQASQAKKPTEATKEKEKIKNKLGRIAGAIQKKRKWIIMAALAIAAYVVILVTFFPFKYTVLGNGTIEITGYRGIKTGDLVIPNTIKGIQVTSIGEDAFNGCSGFTGNLSLPEGLTNIGDLAFWGCSGFTGNLSLPEGLTSIGDSAFTNCRGFTGNLSLPAELTSIGYYAFSDCSGFTGNLSLPEGLTDIKDYAFKNCSGFTGDLLLPEELTTLGDGIFLGCDNLNVIY